MGLVNVFTGASLALAASLFPRAVSSAACPRAVPSAVLPQGTVTGFRDASQNSVFLGIPFAATTGGENR